LRIPSFGVGRSSFVVGLLLAAIVGFCSGSVLRFFLCALEAAVFSPGSGVPAGTRLDFPAFPALKAPGYCQTPYGRESRGFVRQISSMFSSHALCA
jgi:hypothetical protein